MSTHQTASALQPTDGTASFSARASISGLRSKATSVALAAIFLWFGGMKFTQYEAQAIKGLVANSPFISFSYHVLGADTVSYLIGIVEVAIALLLLGRFISPRLSLVGGFGAAATFVLTFSFFFTTPGVSLGDLGFPAISVVPGQFLLKDLGLFFLALVVVSDSLREIAARRDRRKPI